MSVLCVISVVYIFFQLPLIKTGLPCYPLQQIWVFPLPLLFWSWWLNPRLPYTCQTHVLPPAFSLGILLLLPAQHFLFFFNIFLPMWWVFGYLGNGHACLWLNLYSSSNLWGACARVAVEPIDFGADCSGSWFCSTTFQLENGPFTILLKKS